MSYYYFFMKVYILIYFFIYTFSKLIPPEYNKENVQDPNLDESFSETNGRSFIIKGYDKTKFNIVLTPNITLKVYIKIYTDSESLIEGLENGYKLFFGFDFKTHNINYRNSNEYNTDIIVCIFDKIDVNCYDYVYDTKNEKYIRNNNGTLSMNNIIPLGFQNLTLSILTEKVIEYKNYYCINFNKKYMEQNNNYTYINWVKNMSNGLNHKIIGFFGIAENDDDIIEFSRKDTIYYSERSYIRFMLFIKYALIFYFLFIYK